VVAVVGSVVVVDVVDVAPTDVVVVTSVDEVVVVRSAIAGVTAMRNPSNTLPRPTAARIPDRKPVREDDFTSLHVTGLVRK
jgi:hypothetical protein